jgi:hypothetical protein
MNRVGRRRTALPPALANNQAASMTRLLCIAALASLAQPALAQEDGAQNSLSVTTGVDFSSGDYGTDQTTDILVVPFSVRYAAGDWRFNATLPYLQIDGASSVVGGGGGPIVIDPDAPPSRRDGLGDVFLGATYSALREETAGLNLDVGAAIKVPTASREDGLGTGEVDYSVSADVSKSFGDVIPFVTLGYRVPGEPVGIDLKSSMSASAGATVIVGANVVILSYDYRQSSSALVDDAQDLFGAFSGPWGEDLNWTVYGSAGLSEGSPDFGVGLMLSLDVG